MSVVNCAGREGKVSHQARRKYTTPPHHARFTRLPALPALLAVGNLLYGERPSLVAGRRLLWRVPVWLALPTTGPLGQVGVFDVDAQTGEILFDQPILDEIEERGNVLARQQQRIKAGRR